MKRSVKLAKQRAEKRARKAAGLKHPGGKSRYAKRQEARNRGEPMAPRPRTPYTQEDHDAARAALARAVPLRAQVRKVEHLQNEVRTFGRRFHAQRAVAWTREHGLIAKFHQKGGR